MGTAESAARRQRTRGPLPTTSRSPAWPPPGRSTIEGEAFAVTGLAWMDHEFFADYPIEGKVGWDWMSIQLDDGADLMLFGIRDAKGGHGPDTTGTLVDAGGGARHLEFGEVILRPGRRWRSELTEADYPVEWEVEVPRLGLRLDVRPRIDAQEVFAEGGVMPAYWEGAVRVAGERQGRPVTGAGYLEMTGYREKLDIAGDRKRSAGKRRANPPAEGEFREPPTSRPAHAFAHV